MELQTFGAPLSAVLTVKRSLVICVPLLEFDTPIFCFLDALYPMAWIPFLFVILALVSLQILFPTFPRLLKSPLWPGIIGTFAVGLMLHFSHESLYLLMCACSTRVILTGPYYACQLNNLWQVCFIFFHYKINTPRPDIKTAY